MRDRARSADIMAKTRPFRFLAFTTYLPLPLLGIMVIFALMGKFLQVGWLESAPDVLMIPMWIAYYVSLLMGALYGFIKKEDAVYLVAFVGIAVWVVGGILGRLRPFQEGVMISLTIIFLTALLILHVFQYRATKKWEARLQFGRQ